MILLLAFVALASAMPDPRAIPTLSFESRIVGGSNANIADFPWQCSLRYSGSHTCGCSILGSTKVMTAAHCTAGRAVSGFSMYAGSNSRLSGGQLANAVTKTEHPNYNNGACTFCNDIGTMTMTSLSGDNIGQASLAGPGDGDFAGQTCTLTGWGRTSSSNILPEMLQRVDMGVISTAECSTRMEPVSGTVVSSTAHICIFDGSSGSCNGDSGGPMNCGNLVAGVTSWGISGGGACLQTYPSVYARVSTYKSWVEAN